MLVTTKMIKSRIDQGGLTTEQIMFLQGIIAKQSAKVSLTKSEKKRLVRFVSSASKKGGEGYAASRRSLGCI